jgi:hypothetical protein
MKFNYENLHRKSPKPLWFRTFLPRYLNRFALLVAEKGFEPHSLRAGRMVAVPRDRRSLLRLPAWRREPS